METRLILAYSIIAIVIFGVAYGVYIIRRNRRKTHLLKTGRAKYNQRTGMS